MTRSIFDPTGPDAEHSGTRNLGPEADNISHMPPEVVDGESDEVEAATPDESAETEQIAGAEAEVEREQKLDPDSSRS